MNCKYKFQILEGMVYSSLTFFFIQTYSFVGIKEKKKKEKEKKQKERKKNEKKVHFDGTPLRDCLLLSYQKKSSVKRFLSTNFSFLICKKATKLCNYSPRSSR